MDQNLLTQIAQPTNDVAKAYQDRTALQTSQHDSAQKQSDAAMLKVFEFAGDGRPDEARLYAQRNGVQVPDQVFQNADLAKGLALGGKLYDKDPVAAQKFTMGWMQNPAGDLQTRIATAQQAAGVAIDPNDRDYQRKIAFELWKEKNLSPKEKPQISRFEAGQNAYNDVMKSGLSTEAQANQARDGATKFWDSQYPGQYSPPAAPAAPGAAPAVPGAPSPGLLQNIALPAFGSAPAVPAAAANPAMAAPGAAPGSGSAAGQPLAVRNNNPGNMREPGATMGFQHFKTPQEGQDAMINDLLLKVSGQSPAMQAKFGAGYQPTLQNVISTWAPENENNTAAYVMYVSQKTGIGPNQVLTPADIQKIQPAMAAYEAGSQQAPAQPVMAQQPQTGPQNGQVVPSGLPQGSVMIGTSGGRPVYKDPQGNTYIDDGNP